MKKIATMLVLIMTLALLAGCGGSQQEEQPGGNGVQDIVDQMNDQLEEQGKINESQKHEGEDEHYVIKNAEDLLAFAESVNVSFPRISLFSMPSKPAASRSLNAM